jgi:hypothetical protein
LPLSPPLIELVAPMDARPGNRVFGGMDRESRIPTGRLALDSRGQRDAP